MDGSSTSLSESSSESSPPRAVSFAGAASVQSHIAVRRASGSKPSMLASSKIIERASLETAAQTCSRYSFSSILSPLAFSTRECLEKISSAGPRHAKIASAPTTPSSARRGIHSCIRRGNACNTSRQSATSWRAAASLAFSRGRQTRWTEEAKAAINNQRKGVGEKTRCFGCLFV